MVPGSSHDKSGFFQCLHIASQFYPMTGVLVENALGVNKLKCIFEYAKSDMLLLCEAAGEGVNFHYTLLTLTMKGTVKDIHKYYCKTKSLTAYTQLDA